MFNVNNFHINGIIANSFLLWELGCISYRPKEELFDDHKANVNTFTLTDFKCIQIKSTTLLLPT